MSFVSRTAMRAAAVTASLAVTAVTVGYAVQNAERTTPDFTQEQVQRGEQVYTGNCQGCHGPELQGRNGPSLVGESFESSWLSGEPMSALYEKISQQMPFNAPGSLSEQQYLDVTAYVLARNGYEPTGTALSTDNLSVELQPPGEGDAAGDAEEEEEDPAGSQSGGQGQQAQSQPADLPRAPQSVKQASTSTPTDEELLNAAGRPDWLMYNKDYRSQRYSPLSQITAQNAANLRPVCMLQLGETGTFQTGMVVYEGVMYATTQHGTYAMDANTCERLWEHTYSPTGEVPFNTNRGVAIYDGKLIRGTTDGHLIALDKENGELLWDAHVADGSQGYFLSSAPIAWNGLVFMGEAGADWGIKGHMYAFDADTGELAWTFDVIPTGDQEGADTWQREGTTAHGGGSMWTSYTLDPESGLLYIPVGNPAPDFAGDYRPGANLFTNSMVVLAARTGELQWYKQQIANDYHDWDTAAAPVVYDTGGNKYAAIANKGGHLYIYDRNSKEQLHRVPVTTFENESAPLTEEGTRFCPGTLGGVEWNGPALDPERRALFVNSVDWCTTIRTGPVRYNAGSVYLGSTNGFGDFDPAEQARGWVHAVDAATGEVKWEREIDSPMVAALTPTAGGVVFTGDLDGNFLALNADTGEDLYRFNTGGAVAGGVVTYELDGRQYVAVASGNSSRTIWETKGAATLIVFALPEGNR